MIRMLGSDGCSILENSKSCMQKLLMYERKLASFSRVPCARFEPLVLYAVLCVYTSDFADMTFCTIPAMVHVTLPPSLRKFVQWLFFGSTHSTSVKYIFEKFTKFNSVWHELASYYFCEKSSCSCKLIGLIFKKFI